VAARQLRERGQPLHTFSKLARRSGNDAHDRYLLDESQFVNAVLTQESDIHWTPVYQPALDIEGIFEPDFALGGPFAVPDENMSALAACAGSSIMLSGAGGDEGATFNGMAILPTLLRSGRWATLYSEIRARARRSGVSAARVAKSQLLGPIAKGFASRPSERRNNALCFVRPHFAQGAMELMKPEVLIGSSSSDRVRWLTASQMAERSHRWSILAARYGQGLSYPLADREIVDFGLSLPIERLVDDGFARQPFRNSMKGILPEHVRCRTTKFVAFPDLERNLRTALPALLSQVETVRHSAAAAAMFDFDAIRSAFRSAAEFPRSAAPVLLANGQPKVLLPIRMAQHGLRALTMARYVARMSG
jgi:asparagine synthase (glutamine-hydrolysing)